MKTGKRFAVIENCNGDEWMLGIYDSYEQALGAVLADCLKELDDIRENIRAEEDCELTFDSREDGCSGAYVEITARYSETSYNSELEHIYRVYFEPEEKKK